MTPSARILVRGEPWYQMNIGMSRKVLKPNVDFSPLHLTLVPVGMTIKKNKICDMMRLLRLHFGDRWEGNADLQLYHEVINKDTVDEDVSEDELEGGMMEDADEL
ncbi:hypothetical protein L9F63_023832 [Diploptera punctata]|uniref:Uncharacterized protein n=1 Tax=Diploptera punctata TaxID=6984 RepID=A0AAD8E8B8_DIPPU|nr:hypothetical protein L9F63_023832 [Diploptera punctata]